MRALAVPTICFILGASTACGGEGPDIYGAYDLVSENGESLPTATTISGRLDWRADGSWTITVIAVSVSEPVVFERQSSAGEEADGCIPFQIWAIEAPDEAASGTVCNGVITMANAGGVPLVFHKRL